MKKVLLALTLMAFVVGCAAQTGTGWFPERRKVNQKDSIYFAKDANFASTVRISGVAITSNAAELNILDGALCNFTELNRLVGVTSNIQTQLNAKQATLVSGVNIKTVNGESILGGGNIELDSTGGSMVYPGAGIPLSTGTAWGTSIADNSVEWDSAYVARLRWDGGTTGLTASTGRTSLGGTTIGQSMFTLGDPNAITFPRFNANNTVSALSAANFKTALSLTASDVGLGNVTNESKATMFTSPTFTTQVTLPATTYVPSAGVISFDSGDVTLTHGPNVLTVGGGNLALGTNSLTLTGSIGATGARVTKGWFTDLESTNAIAGSITGNAATVTGFTRNAGTLTLTGGHGITATTTGTTAVSLPTSGTLATTQNINDTMDVYIAAAIEGVAVSDTATMLNNYARNGEVATTYAPKASPTFTGTVTTAAIEIGNTSLSIDSVGYINGSAAVYDGADTVGVYVPYADREIGVTDADYQDGLYDVVNTGTVVAGTGITAAMLSRIMYFNTAAAIDISADPQIANGTAGQVITIIGSSDTNTLTLDDSAGLRLSAQMVLGIGDSITLIYIAGDVNDWVEISRSAN